MTERVQIFNISVETQCDLCVHGEPSNIFSGEWLCDKKCEEILYPELRGDKKCPHFEAAE